ncbi:MAG TPA: hypothetical protein VJZ27_00955 [Aggregatilineales bacterium]|nr:hypothetical protein [Aggregatilineales bacterium]
MAKGEKQLIDHAIFKKALQESQPIAELREVIVALRAEGISKDDLIDELGSLREEVSEEDEDNILIILDFITGFCSPHHDIK